MPSLIFFISFKPDAQGNHRLRNIKGNEVTCRQFPGLDPIGDKGSRTGPQRLHASEHDRPRLIEVSFRHYGRGYRLYLLIVSVDNWQPRRSSLTPIMVVWTYGSETTY